MTFEEFERVEQIRMARVVLLVAACADDSDSFLAFANKLREKFEQLTDMACMNDGGQGDE